MSDGFSWMTNHAERSSRACGGLVVVGCAEKELISGGFSDRGRLLSFRKQIDCW